MRISNLIIIVLAIAMYGGIYVIAAHFLLKGTTSTLVDPPYPTPPKPRIINSMKIETDTGTITVEMPKGDTILVPSDITTNLTGKLLVNDESLPKEYNTGDLTAKSGELSKAEQQRLELERIIREKLKNSPFKEMYCGEICQIYKDSIMAAHSFPHNDPYFVACKTGPTFKRVFDEIQGHDLILD